MLINYNIDPQSQANSDNPEPEFLDSPFDRWLRLADVIIQKHSNVKFPAEKAKKLSGQFPTSH
jgi:hypothetical protein